jgi:MFS family permease
MFGVDAFIVNVAIPTIAGELHASPAQIEAVIAIYLIAYATLVVTGGRLGDIHGTKNVFLAGVFGFSVTWLWCGLARSGPELIAARLARGATAALLGLAGAAGFLLGGVLVTLDLAGHGGGRRHCCCSPHRRCLRCRLWPVPRFCHGCGTRCRLIPTKTDCLNP